MHKTLFHLTTLVLTLTGCATKQQQTVVQSPSRTIAQFSNQTQKIRIDRIIKGIDKKNSFLTQKTNTRVHYWINQFAENKRWGLQKHISRSLKYQTLVKNIFKEHGLPEDLFYVAMIESGYKYNAKSSANAVGYWQFIKPTAKRYGLIVNSKVDERQNIHKSTIAAAKFFQDLYNIFGSWELALAAYNAGEYGIIRRIRGANTRDFHQLVAKKAIPKETRNYIPKIKAIRHIMQNPKRYSVNIPINRNGLYLYAKKYTVKKSLSLKTISKQLNIPYSTVSKLNSDLKRGRTLSLRSGFDIYLPKHIPTYKVSALKSTPYQSRKKIAKRSHIYKVRKGDSLIRIARKHSLKLRNLLAANKLKYRQKIYIGQTLKIPHKDKKLYQVRRGDNLIQIARKYQTSVKNIKRLNELSRSTIYPGQTLLVKLN